MKYKNARDILPEKLLDAIQDYIQGEYLYIPKREKTRWDSHTEYKQELEKRDARIYTRHLEGIHSRYLAKGYHLSESSIRRIISERRKEYETMQEKIRHIITNWNLKGTSIDQIYDTAWKIDEAYILKVYTDRVAMERNLAALKSLAETNIPVGKIIPAKGDRDFVEDGEYCFFLSERLPGSNVVDIHGIPDLEIRMGGIIADLHLAFQKCELKADFWDNSLLEEMKSWVRENLEKADWKYVSREEYEETVSNLERDYDKLPVQLIHRDVHFGNFLFDGERFSGYIDFDLSQRNIRIFDLCYFLLGLLSEQEDFIITPEQWYIFLKGVLQGYVRKIPLKKEEKEAIPYVMEAIELLFAAWFFGEGDLKCAEDAAKIYGFVKENEQAIKECVYLDLPFLPC